MFKKLLSKLNRKTIWLACTAAVVVMGLLLVNVHSERVKGFVREQWEKWFSEKTIQKLVYNETGPFGPTDRYTIDFKEEIYIYEHSNTKWEIGNKGYVKRNLDKKTVRKIKTGFHGFNAKNWKDRYSDPMITDGTFWDLQIYFTDGSSRRISGANAWPSDFSKRLQVRVSHPIRLL